MSLSFNPLAIVTDAAESICHAVLPKELGFVGDLFGLASDVQSANIVKGLEDIRDLERDMAQTAAYSGGHPGKTGDTGGTSSDPLPQFFEPSPPPPYKRAGFGFASLAPTTGAESPIIRGISPDQPASVATPSKPGIAPNPAADPPSSVNAPIPTNTSRAASSHTIVPPTKGLAEKTDGTSIGGEIDSSAGPDPARSTDSLKSRTTASSVTVAGGATTDPLSETNAAESASPRDQTASLSAASSLPAGSVPTGAADAASPDGFFQLSDKDLMNAVRDGKIPDSVSKDPEQMRRLQMRINDISQMNQLITTMLSTLHELNKQIIQNLHV